MSALSRFDPATRAWFEDAFGAPTAAQAGAWSAISSGQHALVIAPTGSGKTLSAFLWAIDRLLFGAPVAVEEPRTRVLYISPLKALGVDVERNLRVPLAGIAAVAADRGEETQDVRVGVRSGDTAPADRRRLLHDPPDILITTPESLYLMLTSAARETLTGVGTVVVDEVHAVAGTKRGAHLALSLERLDELLPAPAQRIGLSATVEPADEVARFLGGRQPVEIVRPPSDKAWDLTITVPVPDLADLSRDRTADDDPERIHSIWPDIEERLVDHVLAHRSTLVFANSRRSAEKLTTRMNEVHAERLRDAGELGDDEDPPVLARSHHGSVAIEQRSMIEGDLKAGRLRCVVATSSLELGIDMGAIDLVIQVAAPFSVASGLQRVGRAGHQVGEVSRGIIFPTHRADLVHAAVVGRRMISGAIEPLHVVAGPLDILAQHTVSACALGPLDVEEWWQTVRRAAPFADLPRSAFEGTLGLLAGRYPSDEFAELRPRVVWDHEHGTLTGRPGSQRLAVTSGGTIPDRGLYPVYLLAGDETRGPRRVGELDEEMVFETRVGDIIALGATSWRVEEITPERVSVVPAPGVPGRLPFWHGEDDGRPAVLGAAMGGYVRELEERTAALGEDRVRGELREAGLDAWAADNLLDYLRDQRRATGLVPADDRLVVERFRDELGDWRVVCHTPYGKPVNAPWALAVARRVRERHDVDPQVMASDDGIVLRVPATDATPPDDTLFRFDPDELVRTVSAEAEHSALFAARFRECAARALLLPRRDPTKRSPLWQQRHRSAQLLQVASRYPAFPIVLEAMREVLLDAYDIGAMHSLHERIARHEVTLTTVETVKPSPFASSLLLGYVGQFLYDGDVPLAERRAAALGLDQKLLGELLGATDLADLLDPAVIERVEAELQHTAPDRRLHGLEGVADLLRLLGPLTVPEITARLEEGADPQGREAEAVATYVDALVSRRRAILVDIGGVLRVAAVEDAARLRDALGTVLPPLVPAAHLEAVPDPLRDLVGRYARTHGPFVVADAARQLGMGAAVVQHTVHRLVEEDRLVAGEFVRRADGVAGEATQYVDAEVLRVIRRRSLSVLRAQVKPVDAQRYASFQQVWQHVGDGNRVDGEDGVLSVVDQLAGIRLPASAWESLVLPARVDHWTPGLLDALVAGGDVLWAGDGALAGGDGWLTLHLADAQDLTLPTDLEERAEAITDPVAVRVHRLLAERGGAYLVDEILEALVRQETDRGRVPGSEDGSDGPAPLSAVVVAEAVTTLAWAGLVTSDTYASVRAMLRLGQGTHRTPSTPTRGRPGRPGRLRLRPPALAARSVLPGRWSLLRPRPLDATVRASELAQLLLDRHGVVTRGAVELEGLAGGFAAQYRVLTALEENGRCRRGYFVADLGPAQFAEAGTVDLLRRAEAPDAVLLAATDPANPYGAALPWPEVPGEAEVASRPGRRSGALVVLAGGAPVLFLERGGRTLLAFTDDRLRLADAGRVLADAVQRGAVDTLSIETVNGLPAMGLSGAPVAVRAGLVEAGAYTSPRAIRLRRT
ncbi:ATP-dependent helicase [Raineyella fluvialis]|uniref:ATP-dependent helicase n=1 Tax=Raineyella fluvialis TaxID=2662261 RepID=A0A5Q2FA77_9ACTN|nr:ATP-dependent helicase [Raineyella fluvialis]QGF23709.1 ATP-dependent helicase [Raineyella fluvialis]